AVAIYRGHLFAKDSGLLPICDESDAQMVVNIINSSSVPLSDVGLIIHDIRLFLVGSPGCCVTFVPRLVNLAAHGLAKFGLSIDGNLYCMEKCPPVVAQTVLGDCPRQA
ncbi:hypothetical protein Ddye_007498, partial [Dipteronia dyeriana]